MLTIATAESNLEALLLAADKLRACPDLRIQIIHTPARREQLEFLFEVLDPVNVRLLDSARPQQVPALMANADISYICHNRIGGRMAVPSSVYTALSAGQPAIYAGPPESEAAQILLESESALIVDCDDVNALVSAIRQLTENHELRFVMGHRAREYYEYNFGRSQRFERLSKVIEQVI